jgi:hypothetical protein
MEDYFIRQIAEHLEPVIKKRIADELYPKMDEILREEIAKVALQFSREVAFDRNGSLTITIKERR